MQGEAETTTIQVKVENGKVELFHTESIPVEDTFVMSYETLQKLYDHELTMPTAMSCAKDEAGNMTALIEPKYKDESRIIHLQEPNNEEAVSFAKRLHKMDDFFNKDKVGIAKVGSEYGRSLHGANAIGLFSDFEKGVLHVYFEVREGEVIQEPAIPFSIYVLQGKGMIEVGDSSIPIESDTYYHLSPDKNIQIRNCEKECMKLLYLAQK